MAEISSQTRNGSTSAIVYAVMFLITFLMVIFMAVPINSSIGKQIILSPNLSRPTGPFSHAIRYGDTVYVSGTLGRNPKTSQFDGGIDVQTHQALRNIGEVLRTAGSSFDKVVKATVLLTNMNDYTAMNEVYAKYFPRNFPARSAYQVAQLPSGALVEIEVIAVV